MLKVITGPPRAGKTYWAVRHVLLTYFKWDNELFTWVPKDENALPFILTNIDGLRIPHHTLELFLKKLNLTLPEFLTLENIVPFVESLTVPFVLLLDEAHGVFPFNFKDKGAGTPDKSTLYFFGYHGHYPIDIYLITHSWTDLCQSIAQRAEYQIDAERRTMSAVGEFRYFYLHPKTQDKLNTQTVKSDKRIHMMYLSSSGEHKTNEIKPIRRTLYLVLIGLLITVFALYKFVSSFGHKKQAATPRPAVGAGAVASGRPQGALTIENGQALPRLRSYSTAGLKLPDLRKQQYVQVSLSGAWVADKMIAVDLFGDIIPLADLPYSYSIDKSRRRAIVAIPDDALASLRPGLWVDNANVLSKSRVNTEEKPPSSAPPFGQVTPPKT